MGSGTTGVVAKRLNRNFKGIEIDSNYFGIAEKRIGMPGDKNYVSNVVGMESKKKTQLELPFKI